MLATVLATVKVNMPAPGKVTVEGANAAVTPAGNPVTESVTGELNPFCASALTCRLPELPALTETKAALGVMVNVPAAVIVN